MRLPSRIRHVSTEDEALQCPRSPRRGAMREPGCELFVDPDLKHRVIGIPPKLLFIVLPESPLTLDLRVLGAALQPRCRTGSEGGLCALVRTREEGI